jgi:hypothetical protein
MILKRKFRFLYPKKIQNVSKKYTKAYPRFYESNKLISLIMEKDDRYKAVKRLIEKGDITEFNEMFTYIPKTVVARDLGAAPARFSEKMNLIEKFTLQDMFAIAKLLEVESIAVLKLADNQYSVQKKNKKK